MLGHLISFRTDPDPRIVFWKKDEVSDAALLGMEISIKFSDTVLCTGYETLLEKENTEIKTVHHKCPHKSKGKKQCYACKAKDISKIYTRLDFVGFEQLKDEYIDQKFSIYLACFGTDILKCGVTKTERLPIRTHEQGADYWIELMRFDNGEEAYATEIELQNKFGLANLVRNITKLELLNKPKSLKLLEEKIEKIKSSEEFSGKLQSSEIHENKYPIPGSFELAYSIDGKITGSKAQMLFFRKEEKDFVVPMYDSIGRVFILKD